MSALLANLVRRNLNVGSVGRLYIQSINPSANMFLARATSLVESPVPSSASAVSLEMSTACSRYFDSEPSLSGFDLYPAFARFGSVKAPVFNTSIPPRGRPESGGFTDPRVIAPKKSRRSPRGSTGRWGTHSSQPENPGRGPAHNTSDPSPHA